jgi:predicted dienelactone hydrolase
MRTGADWGEAVTVFDIALIGALAAFVLVWWRRSLPGRAQILLALAVIALGVGLAAIWDSRWQAGAGVLVAVVLLLVLLANRLRQTPAQTGRPWMSGILFGLLVVAAATPLVLFPVFALPKPKGPHPVGVRSFEMVDSSRPGLIAAKPGGPRRLLVRVWYPAQPADGAEPRPYFTDAEARLTARTMGQLVGFGPFFTYVKHVRTNSFEDAPLMAGARGLPTVFYSHGYTSFLAQNTVLMEHLASHGYVVFSVQHTYDSSTTVFPNGDVAPADPALFEMNRGETTEAKAALALQKQAISAPTLDERLDGFLRLRETALAGRGDRLLKSGVIWAADRTFVHDQLQAGAAPPAIREIAAAAQLDRVGEMGMSFGGATSGTLCMVDPRCAAGVNLDGGDFPFQAFNRDMPVPFLMFHSDMRLLADQLGAAPDSPVHGFNLFSYESFDRAGTKAGLYRIQLKDSRHLGLSDFSLFVRRPVRNPMFGSAPARIMIGAQNDFVLGFFDRHLRGVEADYPAAQMKAYRDWVTPLTSQAVRDWWAGKSEAERQAITARINRVRGS